MLIYRLHGGLLIFLTRGFVSSFFTLSETAGKYLNIMLIISSYYVVGQILNTLIIAGLLRAGGNTRRGIKCDIIAMWLVSVPLGFFCGFVLKLPPMRVYFILCMDEFWKLPFVLRYYKSYKRVQNIILMCNKNYGAESEMKILPAVPY